MKFYTPVALSLFFVSTCVHAEPTPLGYRTGPQSLLMSLATPLEDKSTPCTPHFSSYQLQLGHIERGGIGYTQGYSTLSFFGALPRCIPDSFVPFVDARLHIFNDGHLAGNLGVGIRRLSHSWVVGAHVFYDYRKTNWSHYNQAAAGLELLGKVFDFRVEGYLPFGVTQSRLHEAKFGHFSNHYLLLARKREFVMSGITAETGIHIKRMQKASFYGAFGPYYFNGHHKTASGAQARLSGLFLNHVEVEIRSSYDSIFHGILQGQLSFLFPLGPKKKWKAPQNTSCSRSTRLMDQALQPVSRNEIIVADKKKAYQRAINPDTNKPYFFWFVNNTSSCDGSFESPFNELLNAQTASSPHDIIYVFQGTGTSRGMQEGFLMQDYQKLWGAGIQHPLQTTVGAITIPALSQGYPTVTLRTNPDATRGIINLANHCEVAGMNLFCSISPSTNIVAGILGGYPDAPHPTLGVNHASLLDNQISGAYTKGGIFLYNSFGTLSLARNHFSQMNSPTGIVISDKHIVTPFKSLSITNNYVDSTPAAAFAISLAATESVTSFLQNTSFCSGNAIVYECSAGISSVDILDNTIKNCGLIGIGVQANASSTITATVLHNSLDGLVGLGFKTLVGGALSVNCSYNTILSSYALSLGVDSSGPLSIDILHNTFDHSGFVGAIGMESRVGNLCANIQFNNIIHSAPGIIGLGTIDLDVENEATLCARIQHNYNSPSGTSTNQRGSGIIYLEPLIYNSDNSVLGPYTSVFQDFCLCD